MIYNPTQEESILFPTVLPYDIPAVDGDLLLSTFPARLKNWVGKDEDEKASYLKQYAKDSAPDATIGKRCILHFYTNDSSLDGLWRHPATCVDWMIAHGVNQFIMPNFSLWHDSPLAVQIFNVYRARWLCRFLQMHGFLAVIDINFSDRRSFDFCFLGLPKRIPCAAIQCQTQRTDDEITRLLEGLNYVLDNFSIGQLLIYGAGRAAEIAYYVSARQCEAIKIENRFKTRRSIFQKKRSVYGSDTKME